MKKLALPMTPEGAEVGERVRRRACTEESLDKKFGFQITSLKQLVTACV